MKKIVQLLAAAALALSLVAVAHAAEHETGTGAKGEQCVEPTDFMRHNHMDLIRHQRDATMRDGIRTSKHSLKGCIDCHAKQDGDGQFMSVKNPEHFCSGCHKYAAVSVDCFQCHTSKPSEERAKLGNATINETLKAQIAEVNVNE
ncbi:hypothetical protein [Candidatus Reidiella endopervernicosa]|nr:hypothetical protein [Candidatus Reidiella endopervernicosa]QKQ26757.1 hypothetical protein HUE57_11020 [Candidatus Reidiella endopervernicosa]